MTHKPSVPPPPHPNNASPDARPFAKGQQREEGEAFSLLSRRERRQMTAIQQRLAGNSRTVVRLFQMLLALIAIQTAFWFWAAWREQQVTATEALGTLQGMTAGSGWRGRSVIEVRTTTEGGAATTRFYPLDEPMAAKQGTPLILETRANGELFICDAQRHACVRTASEMLR